MDWKISHRIEQLLNSQSASDETIGELYGLIAAVERDDESSLLLHEIEILFESTNTSASFRRSQLAKFKGLFGAQKIIDSSGLATAQLLEVDTGSTTFFELPEDSHERALALCAEIRNLVNVNEKYDEEKKVRLVKRISAMEVEFHRSKGMLGIVIGNASEISDFAKKFGEDAEPLVKRLKEICSLAKSGTDEQDLLEAPKELKKLPAPDNEQE